MSLVFIFLGQLSACFEELIHFPHVLYQHFLKCRQKIMVCNHTADFGIV